MEADIAMVVAVCIGTVAVCVGYLLRFHPILKKPGFRRATQVTLLNEFGYDPGKLKRLQRSAYKQSIRTSQARKGTPEGTASVFMLSQINARSHEDHKTPFVRRTLETIGKLASRMTSNERASLALAIREFDAESKRVAAERARPVPRSRPVMNRGEAGVSPRPTNLLAPLDQLE